MAREVWTPAEYEHFRASLVANGIDPITGQRESLETGQERPVNLYCRDERHDTPCPLPCGGCEADGCDPVQLPCDACGTEAGEECRPMCTGQAAAQDAAAGACGYSHGWGQCPVGQSDTDCRPR